MITTASLQQRQAASPTHSCWVEASAGTGKTKVLTDRVLMLLLTGAVPENILCLTFTKAAAAEMANRIQEKLAIWASFDEETLRQELSSLLSRAPTRQELDRATSLFATVIDVPGGMKIQTIHSFCQMVLKKFSLEAKVPPHFRVMTDAQSKDCLERSFKETMQDLSSDQLKVFARYVTTDQLFDLLKSILQKRSRIVGKEPSIKMIEDIYTSLKIPFGLAPDKILEEELKGSYLETGPQDFFDLLEQGTTADNVFRGFLKKWILKSPQEKVEDFETYKKFFLTAKNEQRQKIVSASFAKKHPELEEVFQKEAAYLMMVMHRYHHAIIAEATNVFLHFIHHALDRYHHLKTIEAFLDYDDLIYKTAVLFQQPENAPWVLYKLDGGIQHILVDEAQDTNEDQWQVIASIAAEFFSTEPDPNRLRTLFVVGDMKQSIYSFQGANPFAFQAVKSLFSAQAENAKHSWKNITLSTSFRSTQPVLDLVDQVFQKNPTLSPPGLNLDYVPHESYRKNHGGRVEVWPLVNAPEKEEREPWALPNTQIYATTARKEVAERIAERIHLWLQEKRILEPKNRPIRPSDIMILVRRRDQFVEELVRALKNKSIPVTGADRLVLTDHMGIMDLLVLGDFLLLPEDDLALATILKSPLIGMEEHDLFELSYYRKGRSLWHTLKQRQTEKPIYQEAFAYLTDLLNRVDFYSPFDFYHYVLHILPGRQKMLERLGNDAEDALEEFLNLCLSFEKDFGGSLQIFLSWMRKENTEIKRNLEQSTEDKVRIMTVHGSKGLEAPIVFLPDTTQVPSAHASLFWGQSIAENPVLFWCPKSRFKTDYIQSLHPQYDEQAEYYRLLYVALTRAEDELYVCGWKNHKASTTLSWYDLVLGAAQDLGISTPLCFDGKTQEDGLVIYQKAEEILSSEPIQDVLPFSKSLPSWVEKKAKAESVLPIIYPSQQGEIDGQKNGIESSLRAVDRGILLHKALEWLIKDPGVEREGLTRQFLEQYVQKEEADRLFLVLQKTLDLLALHSYFAEGIILTEVPFQRLDTETNSVVKGTMDFLWVNDTLKEVHVIDYKTGVFDYSYKKMPPEAYKNQIILYQQALQVIYPSYKIRPFLLWTEATQLVEYDFEKQKEN